VTAVTYAASRSIIGGHTSGETYSIDLKVTDISIERQPSLEVQQSLDGHRETIRFNAVEIYAVTLGEHTASEILQIREFLDSVEAREDFTFDAYGSSNVPVLPMTASIDSTGYQLSRVPRGQGGANDGYRTSFRVRVLVP